MKPSKIGGVVLASGMSQRFGSNKLTANFNGRPLFQHTFDLLLPPLFYKTVVVTRFEQIRQTSLDCGFIPLLNQMPQQGQSHTIHLGIQAFPDADALMFLPTDQPMLQRESLLGMLQLFQDNPGSIVALSYQGKRGSPCLFDRQFFPQLMQLSGDAGGREIIQRNFDHLLLFPAKNKNELIDIDTTEQLEQHRFD